MCAFVLMSAAYLAQMEKYAGLGVAGTMEGWMQPSLSRPFPALLSLSHCRVSFGSSGGDRAFGEAEEEARGGARENTKVERERRRDEAADLRHALTTTAADERTQFKFEPTRAGIATTLIDFIAYLSKKHPDCMQWRKLIIDGETVDKAMAIMESDVTLTKVDRFFHTSITAVVDKGTKLGTLFTDKERELDGKDARKASSGYALVARLDGFQAIEEAREHIKKVLNKHTLKAGAEEADTKTKINRIRDGQKELPAQASAVRRWVDMHGR